jgi:hypothetical protein
MGDQPNINPGTINVFSILLANTMKHFVPRPVISQTRASIAEHSEIRQQ